ncbi:MAG: hypothetical protein K9L68_03530 [Spirochaetales bacterium]|nr:hypothetical protein [Spirochaetales bacterium]
MALKAVDLFQAYHDDMLPREGGWIVTSFFDPNSTYSKYEVVAYSGVKGIFLNEEGMTFQSDGNKLFVLVEPPSYPKKQVEPYIRDTKQQIPHRFSELNTYTTKNQIRVLVSKEPVMTYSSFTITTPHGLDFSILFYNLEDVYDTIDDFFQKTFNREGGIPRTDARNASKLVVEGLKKFTIW